MTTKRLSFWAIFAMMCALPAGAQQASPIEAKLVLPDTKILPGMPFEAWIDLSNPADTAISVGLFPRLLVRPEGQPPFETSSDNPPILWSADPSFLTLQPRETKTLTMPVSDGPSLFNDPRLSPPGRYVLSVRLERTLLGIVGPPVTYRGPVVTNDVVLERIDPVGIDAVIWKRMQQIAKGQWQSAPRMIVDPTISNEEIRGRAELWRDIETNHSDSNYLPYVLLNGYDRPVERLSDAARRFSASPVFEALQVKIWKLTRSNRAYELLRQSKRPTTHILAFGPDRSNEPCPPEHDCDD